ncbi:MFS transporter [Limnohabitans planktonicus]|uniref:MFS transporter n=1 Tax=Limnohabitans planktonicus II-D5 TaxID=1293045 RepID=A0A2T7UGJ7_9BURK|nr:MFS transporter [Limnohabitans planktonicus]PVE43782.1 MFS transporter [Limnohabitans planktonicus II-D5]|eukprot:gene5632-5510_t
MSPAFSASFQRLAWSNLLAQSAEQLSLAAVPIVAVLLLQAGPGEIGLLASIQSLPFLLLSMPLGLLADRTSRTRLMALAETLRALALLLLLALIVTGHVSIAALAIIGFMAAVGTVAFSVAAPSLVPALVQVDGLAQANGRLELARSAAFAAGPALAGALIAWTGASAAFVLSGMLSVAAVLCLRGIVEPTRAAMPARHPLLELQDGAKWVWQSDLLRPMMFCSVAWNISWFMLQAAYVPYAIHDLGLDASGVGVTLALYGVGMILGALLAPRVVRALPFGQAILLGPYFSVLAAVTMALTLYWPQGWLAALSYFFFGVGPIIWTITSTTLRQTVTPRAMIGRVTSINIVASTGARPLGAALGGVVGVSFPVSVSLWCVVLGFGLQAIIISASKIRTLKRLPEPLPD